MALSKVPLLVDRGVRNGRIRAEVEGGCVSLKTNHPGDLGGRFPRPSTFPAAGELSRRPREASTWSDIAFCQYLVSK